jgi:hypothetical protein
LTDRAPWLDAFKQHNKKKSTVASVNTARVYVNSANESLETLTQHTDRTDRGHTGYDESPARATLLELFNKDLEWRSFFRSCCERSTSRLMAQAWQFGDELKERGHPYLSEEVEDALLGLARELLPQSPAAQWDTKWAHALCKDALAHLAKHYAVLSAEKKDALDLSGQDVWDERMRSAGLDNDPVAFRMALKGWEREGLEAMKRVGARGGAA